MDPLSIAIAGATSLLGLGIGVVVGRSTAEMDDEPVPTLVTDSSELRRLRDRAVTSETELQEERAKVARLSTFAGETPSPPTEGRPSRAVLQAFATRLLELGPVRAALVAGPDGLPATRCEDERCLALAGLVPALDGDGLREVRLVAETGDHFTLRRLPAWTEGAWLVVRGQSGFVNPLALDLVTASFGGEAPRSAILADRGQDGGASAKVLLEMLPGARARTLVRIAAGEVVARVSDDGLDREAARRDAQAARDVWRRGSHLARGSVALCALGYADGRWGTLAPVEGDDDLVFAVTAGEPLDELAARRLQGALRRVSTEGEMEAIAS